MDVLHPADVLVCPEFDDNAGRRTFLTIARCVWPKLSAAQQEWLQKRVQKQVACGANDLDAFYDAVGCALLMMGSEQVETSASGYIIWLTGNAVLVERQAYKWVCDCGEISENANLWLGITAFCTHTLIADLLQVDLDPMLYEAFCRTGEIVFTWQNTVAGARYQRLPQVQQEWIVARIRRQLDEGVGNPGFYEDLRGAMALANGPAIEVSQSGYLVWLDRDCILVTRETHGWSCECQGYQECGALRPEVRAFCQHTMAAELTELMTVATS